LVNRFAVSVEAHYREFLFSGNPLFEKKCRPSIFSTKMPKDPQFVDIWGKNHPIKSLNGILLEEIL